MSGWIRNLFDTKYPAVDYPTVIEGVIYGPVRCESLDGSEMYLSETCGNEPNYFKNFLPFFRNGKTWAITHLQKRSTRGWLRMDPYCYHWWNFTKLQKVGESGNGIPGTEWGWYFRSPWSWRWDCAGTEIDGQLRHWIRTKGFLGRRWD